MSWTDYLFSLIIVVLVAGEERERSRPVALTEWCPDFRMLAKATEAGKQLTLNDVEHLMALFGTFPQSVESEL